MTATIATTSATDVAHDDAQLWHDAYGIAWIGACNPLGVQHTLDQHYAQGFNEEHPAIRAIEGHLDFLKGRSLGPELADLGAVLDHAKTSGLHR
jgi:hypothetical protein